jgi:glycosyltransferase involved in cell wall biosynthesis
LSLIGIDVEIITRRFDGLSSSDCFAGAPIMRMPAPGGQVRASLTFVLSTVWFLLRDRRVPDVFHAHELRSPTLAAVCAGWLLGRPVVAHVLRGGLLGDVAVLRAARFGTSRMWLFRRGVDRFIAVSRETRQELLAAGVPDQKIAIVPYGVDTERFRPLDTEERASLRVQLAFAGRRVELVAARLVPEKRFDQLLLAWSTVKASIPDALLVILGDGPERGNLESMARGLCDVRFVGEVRDPVPYLQAADTLVLPSSTEGQPLSLLEAMSTGLVCVGTNIGGISDVLDDGRLGVLVPPDDVAGLARGVIDVLQLPETERRGFGERARCAVLQHHSVQTNAFALRHVYEQLL